MTGQRVRAGERAKRACFSVSGYRFHRRIMLTMAGAPIYIYIYIYIPERVCDEGKGSTALEQPHS